MKQILATLLVLAIAAGGYYAWKIYTKPQLEVPVSLATYSCAQGKSIGAVFYTDKVQLILSDGRELTLPQVDAASSTRYANNDDNFAFTASGNTASVSEGRASDAPTYADCVTGTNAADATQPQDDTTTYSYPPLGFSIQYPKSYSLDESYQYQGLTVEEIPGIKVSIPKTLSDSTNLSSDTGVSIEYLSNAAYCSASLFLYGSPSSSTSTISGITYSVASTSDAGAGNIYEEDVYALAGANPCIAVRYYVHSTQIANYPAGAKVEFNRAQLINTFNQIRDSLTLKSQS